ncbi:hypothetical protein Hanom_Chr12g01101091 [Helianthus anomalus]
MSVQRLNTDPSIHLLLAFISSKVVWVQKQSIHVQSFNSFLCYLSQQVWDNTPLQFPGFFFISMALN